MSRLIYIFLLFIAKAAVAQEFNKMDTTSIRLNVTIRSWMAYNKIFVDFDAIKRDVNQASIKYLDSRGFKDVFFIRVTLYNRYDLEEILKLGIIEEEKAKYKQIHGNLDGILDYKYGITECTNNDVLISLIDTSRYRPKYFGVYYFAYVSEIKGVYTKTGPSNGFYLLKENKTLVKTNDRFYDLLLSTVLFGDNLPYKTYKTDRFGSVKNGLRLTEDASENFYVEEIGIDFLTMPPEDKPDRYRHLTHGGGR